jgi:hypothetical protein
MIVKRKGSEHPVVVACTLVPYRQAIRGWSDAGQGQAIGAGESSQLREILRSWRCIMQCALRLCRRWLRSGIARLACQEQPRNQVRFMIRDTN